MLLPLLGPLSPAPCVHPPLLWGSGEPYLHVLSDPAFRPLSQQAGLLPAFFVTQWVLWRFCGCLLRAGH